MLSAMHSQKTHPMITLSAPRGVTSIGGAKVYAAKFATTQRCHTLESECEEADGHTFANDYLSNAIRPAVCTPKNAPTHM